jgi:hypothetical protein
VEERSGVALCAFEATEGGWGVSGGNDGLCGHVIILLGDGVILGPSHVNTVRKYFHDLIKVADIELFGARILRNLLVLFGASYLKPRRKGSNMRRGHWVVSESLPREDRLCMSIV